MSSFTSGLSSILSSGGSMAAQSHYANESNKMALFSAKMNYQMNCVNAVTEIMKTAGNNMKQAASPN